MFKRKIIKNPTIILLIFIFVSAGFNYSPATAKAVDYSVIPEGSEEYQIEWAKTRQEHLLKLMETDPRSVVEQSFSKSELRKAPKAVKPYLEEIKNITGTLNILTWDNFEQKKSGNYYELNSYGKKYSLRFADAIPDFVNGEKIQLKNAVVIGTKIAIPSPTTESVKTYSKKASSKKISSPSSLIGGSVTGDRKVAVIMFNFADDASEPFTKEEVRKVVFDDTKDWYDEVTFGKLNVSGYRSADGNEDVYGWYTVSREKESCDNIAYQIAPEALEMAKDKDDFQESDYSNIMYIFPNESDCDWAGLAILGSITNNTGETYESWFNGDISFYVVAHELGHNFGMYHAASYTCYDKNGNDVSISDNCETLEYGDLFDVMGSGYQNTNKHNYQPYHMNSIFKTQLGWLDEKNIQIVEQDGTFTLFPIEKKSSDIQTIVIRRGTYMQNEVFDDYYFLEYRRSYGYDNFDEDSNRMIDGIFVRIAGSYDEFTSGLTYLLDMTPGTKTSNQDFYDAALVAGKTFEDDITGITIKTVSISDESATVEIAFSKPIEPERPKCEHANPTVSISPSVDKGYAGDKLKYTLKVTNNESEECGSTTYHFKTEMPDEIQPTRSLEENYGFGILSGESYEDNIYIVSSSEAAVGSYVFKITAEDAYYENLYYASAEATYSVINRPPEKPDRPDQFNVEAAASCDDENKGITITWEDTGAETYYELVRSGGLNGEKTITLSENTVSYTDTDISEGYSYRYKIRACNDAGCSNYTSTKSAKAPSSECVSLIIKKTNKGDGSGTVVITDRTDYTKVTCDLGSDDSECEYKYAKGTKVKLRSKASSDSKFKKWAGDCKGSAVNCNIKLKTNSEVKVKFVEKK